jgi:hypothetical protein
MNKPILYNFTNQPVALKAGEVFCLIHPRGKYDFPIGPIGATKVKKANFGCYRCHMPIRWTKFPNDVAAFSCGCFSVLAALPPTGGLALIDEMWWEAVLDYYLLQEREEKIHSN